MDLKSSLQLSLTKLVESGEIERTLDETINAAVISAIKKAMGPYTDFGKSIEAAVKNSLRFTEAELGLPEYNEMILQIVRAKVEGMTRSAIERQVGEQLEKLLEPAPETITLSRLVEQFIEYVKERRNHGCTCFTYDRISLHITDREATYSDGLFRDIYLDEEADKAKAECSIRLGLFKDELFSLNLRRQNVEGSLFSGPYYGFEKLLVQMKAAKSKVVIDVPAEEIDTEYHLGE